jgi:hypothetical protein
VVDKVKMNSHSRLLFEQNNPRLRETRNVPSVLNPFSRTVALASTQPVTEMSTRNLPGSKGRPARKADNLNAICEPIF